MTNLTNVGPVTLTNTVGADQEGFSQQAQASSAGQRLRTGEAQADAL